MGVVYHMDEFHWEGGWESGHKHIIFLYNIKQQWPHPFDTPDGNPCNTPYSSLPIHQRLGRDLQAATSLGQSFIQHGGEKGGEGKDVSVFALL